MIPRKETKRIVVSATMTDERLTVQEIEWRARKYGYLDAGCHFAITEDGIFECRPVHVIGVGARPHNDTSVIVMLSGKPPFSDRQMGTLEGVVTMLTLRYPDATVVGLCDLPGGARQGAPGFDVHAWWAGLRAASGL